jgi:hypothetical protein
VKFTPAFGQTFSIQAFLDAGETLRVESMPKSSAWGVEVESLPPGKCHLPLATMR